MDKPTLAAAVFDKRASEYQAKYMDLDASSGDQIYIHYHQADYLIAALRKWF